MTYEEADRAWKDRTPIAHVPGGRGPARRVGVLRGPPTWDRALKVHLLRFYVRADGYDWCAPIYDVRVATEADLLEAASPG